RAVRSGASEESGGEAVRITTDEVQHGALLANEAEMFFQKLRLVHQIDLRLAVGAERHRDAGCHQLIRGNNAVAEIPLGRGAGTNRSARAAEQLDFAPNEVNRVNGGEALAEETELMQQFDRPAAIFVEAGIHLGRLLRDVHVNGAPAGFAQPLEPGTRHSSDA